MRKALVIRANGDEYVLEVPTPMRVELLTIRDALDNDDLEYVPMPNGLSMFCGGHGKLRQLEINIKATNLSGLFPHDVIVGPVVIMGGTDPEGNTLGLTDLELEDLRLFSA